jgi:acyl dehydratase
MVDIRFDDIPLIEENIAQGEFGPWGPEVLVDQELIDSFAELTGDRQWIHVDPQRAKDESPFGVTIAHGFLLLSLLPQLSSSPVRIIGHGNAANYGASRLRFIAPVPSGSRIHARAKLGGVEVRSTGTLLTTDVELSVVDAAKPAVLYGMQVLYMPPRSANS